MRGEPLALATEGVAMGRDPIAIAIEGTTIGADGELLIHRGAVIEQYANDEGSLEQSWRFPRRPIGDGGLTVAVSTGTQAYLTTTSQGLHFAGAGGLGFVYSHGTWIDARGETYAVPARFVDGRIMLTVPADVVAASHFPAVLDPTITAERAIDAPLSNRPTGATSRTAQTAFSGSQYLAVWQDRRLSSDDDIYATRMTATGSVTDPLGLVISSAAGVQADPTVAFAGTKFVVAWETAGDIAAATVSTSGVVTQLGIVSGAAAKETRPRLASIGSQALLVWNSAGDVHASRFDGSTFGATFTVAASSDSEVDPVIASDGSGTYLVAYTRTTSTAEITGRLVSSAGVPSGPIDISAGAGSQSQPTVAFGAGNFVVAWSNSATGAIGVYGARVSTSGEVLDNRTVGTSPTIGGVPIAAAGRANARPALACMATSCLVAWDDRRDFATNAFDIYSQRLAPDLTSGTEILVSAAANYQVKPAVVAAGSNYLVAWDDFRESASGPEAIYAARVSNATGLLDAAGFLVVRGTNRQTTPAVARGGAGWLVAWGDSRVVGDNILSSRVSDAGVPAAAATVSGAPARQLSPALSFDGTRFIATWSDLRTTGNDSDIYAARVSSTTGAVQDSTGIAISTTVAKQIVPTAASSNDGLTLIAWQDRRNGFDIYGAVVDGATGALLASDIVISSAVGNQVLPQAAYDSVAGQFLVTWSDARSGASDIYAARVSRAGVVLDPAGVAISTAANGQFTPRVAFDGTRFGVVWEDRRNESADIYGTGVRISGGALVVDSPDGVAVARVVGSKQTQPTIARVSLVSTTGFAVAWTDERNLGSTGQDVYGLLLRSDLSTYSKEAYVISGATGDESEPALAPGAATGGQTGLVTYRRNQSTTAPERVMIRHLTYGEISATCDQVCPGGNCNLACVGASCECSLDCAETTGNCGTTCTSSSCDIDCNEVNNCNAVCDSSSTCDIDCSNSNSCDVQCKQGSSCDIDCTGANDCNKVKCSGAAGCLLDCTDATSCGYQTCEGGAVTSCADGIVACNRACP